MVMEGTDNLSEKKHSLENNLKDELNKFDVGKATSHTVIKEAVTERSAPVFVEDNEPLDDDEYSSEPIHYF